MLHAISSSVYNTIFSEICLPELHNLCHWGLMSPQTCSSVMLNSQHHAGVPCVSCVEALASKTFCVQFSQLIPLFILQELSEIEYTGSVNKFLEILNS